MGLFKRKPKKHTQHFSLGYTKQDRQWFSEVQPFTMTDEHKILMLIHSVRHIIRQNIPGCFVECGVWRGGCVMLMAKVLADMNVNDRDLYLFDTFEGMTAPTDKDQNHKGYMAAEVFEETKFDDREGSDWCYASIEDVQRNVAATDYPSDRIQYIKGKVEDTLPGKAPEQIALLRLDTDWYESTKAEMDAMYPRLVTGGILIIDDYYTWSGSKEAVDEYVKEHDLSIFIMPMSSGAIAIKT